jgi:hypothetical protein
MMKKSIVELKTEFCQLLRSVNRPHTEKVICELERIGFFESPASRKDHLYEPGGLVAHSLNVYKVSLMMVADMRRLCKGIELSEDSCIVASLLHDITKAGRYTKNAKGVYEKDFSVFPAGHGEASVIWLQQQGYPLSIEEILAIRYHMGAYHIPQNEELQTLYKEACTHYPLVPLIHAADTLASQIVETQGNL